MCLGVSGEDFKIKVTWKMIDLDPEPEEDSCFDTARDTLEASAFPKRRQTSYRTHTHALSLSLGPRDGLGGPQSCDE